MITKVRKLSRAFEYEANFEQDTPNTTGLTFAFFAGEAFLGDSLSDISAGTVTVPDAPWAVWLDVTTVTTPVVTAGVLASIPTTDSIVLYTGSTSGGAILQSTVVDRRSFSTGRRGLSVNAPSFILTNDPEASPINTYWPMRARMATWNDIQSDWDPSSGGASGGTGTERQTVDVIFDEAAGDLRAIGVAQKTYGIVGSPTRGEVGPTFLKGNAVSAMGFDGSTDYVTTTINTFSASATGIYYGWFFADLAGQGTTRTIISQADTTGVIDAHVGVDSGNELNVQIRTFTTLYRLDINTPTITPDTWHFYVVVQRGDGNGMQIWLDGVLFNKDTGNTTEQVTGTGTRDDWWDTVWNAPGRQGRYAAIGNTSATSKWRGRLFDIGLAIPIIADFPTLWADVNVDKLNRCAGF